MAQQQVSPLKILRIIRGWNRAELAARAGLHRNTVHLLERGNSPTLATADRLAAALDVGREAAFPEADREAVT